MRNKRRQGAAGHNDGPPTTRLRVYDHDTADTASDTAQTAARAAGALAVLPNATSVYILSSSDDDDTADTVADTAQAAVPISTFTVKNGFAMNETLPRCLHKHFGTDAVSIHLQERKDGLCLDELYGIVRFIQNDQAEMQEVIRGVRQALPNILARRCGLGDTKTLLYGEKEIQRYAETLFHKQDGAPRYLDWMEGQVRTYLLFQPSYCLFFPQILFDEAGYNSTLLNNVKRGVGPYIYEKEPSPWNREGRPHVLVTLQKNHWKLLAKKEGDRLCMWSDRDVRDLPFELLKNNQEINRETIQTLLLCWEADSY